MKNKFNRSGILLMIAVFISGTAFFVSCADNKIEVIRDTDIQNLPTQTGIGIESVYSDSGKVQIIMSTPIIEMYTTMDPPYREFKKGINLFFYEGKEEPEATLSAKYAKFHEDKKLWELRDSVVVVSDRKLETELLYWDEVKDLVYTERFVKITSEDETVMGTGFESNSKFDSYTIKNTSMTIYR